MTIAGPSLELHSVVDDFIETSLATRTCKTPVLAMLSLSFQATGSNIFPRILRVSILFVSFLFSHIHCPVLFYRCSFFARKFLFYGWHITMLQKREEATWWRRRQGKVERLGWWIHGRLEGSNSSNHNNNDNRSKRLCLFGNKKRKHEKLQKYWINNNGSNKTNAAEPIKIIKYYSTS